MTSTVAGPVGGTARSLRISGIVVAVLWVVAIIATDGLENGTTGKIITDSAAAQQTILSHQAVVVVEAMSSCYLAGVLIVFAAALRRVLGETVSSVATSGAAALAAAGIVLGAALSFAELAAAHHQDGAALTTLGYLAAYSFVWKGVTWGVLLLAAGTATLATRTGPRWFAIASLVLGVLVGTGFGSVIFWAVAPVWFALAGFLLTPRRVAAHAPDAALAVGAP